MRCAVATFAKTVGLSPVKTRLASSIGARKAEAFYQLSVATLEETLGALDERFHPHWVVAEEAGAQADQWTGFPVFWTGDGGLGTRLANVSEQLFRGHDAVMLIGTDSPQIDPARFKHALDTLEAHPEECIAGPAEDGGFYLFLCAEPVRREIWEAVTYSVSTTLKELEELLSKAGRKVHRLSVEQDVDILEDLESLHDHLNEHRDDLSDAKRALLDWLDATLE